MTYKLRAGAPFDLDNFFNVPPVDAGPFVNLYPDATVSKIDGGSFNQPATFVVDGGKVPLAGTASYDPNKTYTENDVIPSDVNNSEVGTGPEYWILNYSPRVYRDGYIISLDPLVTIDGSIPPP
jgi:hypothetical protein